MLFNEIMEYTAWLKKFTYLESDDVKEHKAICKLYEDTALFMVAFFNVNDVNFFTPHNEKILLSKLGCEVSDESISNFEKLINEMKATWHAIYLLIFACLKNGFLKVESFKSKYLEEDDSCAGYYADEEDNSTELKDYLQGVVIMPEKNLELS